MKLVIYRAGDALEVLATPLESQKRAREVIRLFRRRFGIETSYRMKYHVKAKSRSKIVALRSILFGMSVYLYNLWKIYGVVVCKA